MRTGSDVGGRGIERAGPAGACRATAQPGVCGLMGYPADAPPNAFTVDLEDWFQGLTSTNPQVDRWPSFESRVVPATRKLLRHIARTTISMQHFLYSAMWRTRHPALIREVRDAGHEIASHGYYHRFVHKMTPDEFLQDLAAANEAIERAAGVYPAGYRAPYFSVNASTPWVFEYVAAAGLDYDASVFPTRNMLYGYPGAPRFPYLVEDAGVMEYPASTVAVGRVTLPVSGGFYVRTLPYAFVKRALRALNAAGQPAIMYVHPWELDLGQDYPHVTARERITHYHGRRGLEAKLRSLFSDFRFTTLGGLYRSAGAGALCAPGTSVARERTCAGGRARHGVCRGCGMLIRELPRDQGSKWDDYVASAPGGLPQHQFAWQDVLREVYGYETRYLAAEESDPGLSNGNGSHIMGVMPLYVVSSALVGRSVTTMPGGLCAGSDEVASALIAAGAEYARDVNAKRFVIHDSRREWPGELKTACAHEAWVVDLRGGEDELWSALHRNIRRQVRIAHKNELTVKVDRSGALLDDFYDVLGQFSHAAGTPVFGKAFLESVVKHFPNGFNIVVVNLGAKPIGGYFQLEMGNTMSGVWGAALREYFDLRPVYLGYWTILADAIEHGFEYLDMGRAPLDSSASKYKGQWNGASTPVYQQTMSLRGAQETGNVATQAQDDGKFQLVRQIWPKLPYPVAQHLGPMLRRHVPFA